MPLARSASPCRRRSCDRRRTSSETRMEITKERANNRVHLRLSGRLDNHWSQSLDDVLHEVAREGARHVRLDFSGVTYLSSAGAAVLLKHQRDAAAVHGSLQISAASERARNTLRLIDRKSVV